MVSVLIMQEKTLGHILKGYLEKEGYKVLLASHPEQAMVIMSGGDRIDFVLSSGLNWKPCYEFALIKYGTSNVAILTASVETVEEMKARGITVFEKPTNFNVLVESVVKACPP